MRRFALAVVLGVVGVGAGLSGCAVTQVAPPEMSAEARRDKAVVYFYREPNIAVVLDGLGREEIVKTKYVVPD